MEMIPQNRVLHLIGTIEVNAITALIDRIIAINKEEEMYDDFYEEEARATIEKVIIHKLIPTDTGQIGITMKRPPVKPIELHINSLGGSLTDGFALVNAITTSNVPVIAYVSNAMSMAVAIALCCSKVITYPYTTFMIHQLSYEFPANLNGQIHQVEHAIRQQKQLDKIILDNSEIPYEDLQKHYNSGLNWVLKGDDIRDYGLTNEIISYNSKRDTTFKHD